MTRSELDSDRWQAGPPSLLSFEIQSLKHHVQRQNKFLIALERQEKDILPSSESRAGRERF